MAEVFVVLELTRDHATLVAGVYTTLTLAREAAIALSVLPVGKQGPSESLVVGYFLNGHRSQACEHYERGKLLT